MFIPVWVLIGLAVLVLWLALDRWNFKSGYWALRESRDKTEAELASARKRERSAEDAAREIRLAAFFERSD